jgi:hypothetical protein
MIAVQGQLSRQVSLILEELAREPDHWFWALEAITNQQPIPSESVGRLEPSTLAWLEWGRREGLLA